MRGIKLLIYAIIIGTLAGGAFYGWSNLYAKYLETSAPTIEFLDGEPRGVGLTPMTIHLQLSDWGAGLDEVVARVHQKSLTKEILRQGLGGQGSATIAFELAGEHLGLEEGSVTLEIKAFDRSFWSNSAQKTSELRVDYRKPRLEVVSVMHNTRRGGAQLLIYKAIDEALAVSGVKVGNETFVGYPAVGLDTDFDNKSLFAVLYSIPFSEGADPVVRLFAQDVVGNGNSINFPYRILSRPERQIAVKVPDEFLRGVVNDLADAAYPRLKQLALGSGESFGYRASSGSDAQLYEKLSLVLSKEWPLDNQDLLAQLNKPTRLERLWNIPFVQQNGVVLSGFGDRVVYKGDWVDSPSAVQTGFEFQMSKSNPSVVAAADGLVTFVGDVGVYGRTVIVDHGLGLSTVYSRLEGVSAKEGRTVAAGEEIGTAGRTGFSRALNTYFEVRIQGVPSDPREWWDRSWFEGHINQQIENAKKSLGLSGSIPLE